MTLLIENTSLHLQSFGQSGFFAASVPSRDPGMPIPLPGSMPADYPGDEDDEVLPGWPTDPIPNPEPENPSLPDPDPDIYTPSDMPDAPYSEPYKGPVQ